MNATSNDRRVLAAPGMAGSGWRTLGAMVGAALLSCAAGGPALADDYPDRPIRLLVGYSPGGGIDAVARMLAPRLSAQLKQQVVVENRAGAAGIIAADAVARAAPDGYTLLMGDSSVYIAQHLQPKMTFDAIKDFTPVASLSTMPLVIIANNDFPARTPAEFIAALKAAPGKYSFATSGVSTVHYLAFEMLKAQTGSEVVHIPYRGASQIAPDVISGQVPIGVVSAPVAGAQAKAGALRAIAMMSPSRLPGSDIPALASALPGFAAAPRQYLLAPAGTPATVIDKLDKAVKAALGSAELVQAAAAQGAEPAYASSTQAAAAIAQESSMWARLIRERNIKIE